MKDRTLMIILLVGGIGFVGLAFVGILAVIVVPNYLEARTRARVARVQADQRRLIIAMESYSVDTTVARGISSDPNVLSFERIARVNADMRTLQAAIEAYAIDNNSYPACTTNTAENHYGMYLGNASQLAKIPTFRLGGFPGVMSLTTPIAYLSNMPRDPFAPAGATYAYFSKLGIKKDAGWILWSPGPDGTYDLNGGNIEKAYEHKGETPSDLLVGLTFDATNGSQSSGDIWRMTIEEQDTNGADRAD